MPRITRFKCARYFRATDNSVEGVYVEQSAVMLDEEFGYVTEYDTAVFVFSDDNSVEGDDWFEDPFFASNESNTPPHPKPVTGSKNP